MLGVIATLPRTTVGETAATANADTCGVIVKESKLADPEPLISICAAGGVMATELITTVGLTPTTSAADVCGVIANEPKTAPSFVPAKLV